MVFFVLIRSALLMMIGLCAVDVTALVRTGQFVHVGSMQYRLLPPGLQSGDYDRQADGMMALNLENYATYLGFERLTLASHLDLDWYTVHSLNRIDRIAFKNDLFWQWNASLALGIATELSWADDACLVSATGDGFQYGLVARWRW